MKNETYISDIFKFQPIELAKDDKIVSYSQFSKFKTCPRSWYLNYVRKIKDDKPSIYLVFGNAMHVCIQYWLRNLFTKGEKFTNALDWATILKNILKDEYMKSYNQYKYHFSSPAELTEYFSDGFETFEYLRKKRSSYFSLRDTELVGIEIPINYPPTENHQFRFYGFIDFVLYNKSDKIYTIYDLKTSKKGWGKYDKENKTKISQIIAYKKYFSEQYQVPEHAINVEYIILRQKIDPNSVWPVSRIQEFKPTSGSRTLKSLDLDIKKFIAAAYGKNEFEQSINDFPAIAGNNGWNCTFCPYKDHELCNPSDRKCE